MSSKKLEKHINLKLKPSMFELFMSEVKYLGHSVYAEGVKTDPDKIEALKSWLVSEHVKKSRFCLFHGYITDALLKIMQEFFTRSLSYWQDTLQ